MALELTEFATGLGFPEGPVSMDDGTVVFVDIERQTLNRAHPGGTVDLIAHLPGGPNGAAIGPDGAAYVCNDGGVFGWVAFGPNHITVPSPNRPNYQGGSIQRVDLYTGETTLLYDSFNGKRLMAPDDLVFDDQGGFWFTDSGIQNPENSLNGAVYYATIDGKMIKKVCTLPMPNGVGLSPDGKTLYVSDTVFGRLWAFEITGPGSVAKGPLPVMPGRVVQTLPGFQWLDSLKVLADGRICVGTIFNGGITVFTPDGQVEHLPVDDMFTTNLTFGGADMMDVWITASSTGRILQTRWDSPGLKPAFTG